MTTQRARPPASGPGRPRVLVAGTGGTIAGSAAATDTHAYEAAVFRPEALLDAVPGLAERADLDAREVFSLDSVELTLADRLTLARRVETAMREAESAGSPYTGVVITHGTDTLAETALLLHATLRTPVPVVITGAMRPADAPGADGPANLADAVTASLSPEARGLGTLAVLAGAVHAGAEVRKRSAGNVEAFTSPHGPLGEVAGGRLHLFARPTRSGGTFPLADLPASLPEVVALLDYPELPEQVREAVLEAAPAGLVHVGAGSGNVDAATRSFLARARKANIVVVRASRTGGGVVTRNGAVNDDALDTVAAGRHHPETARILLALALTRSRETAGVQCVFDTH